MPKCWDDMVQCMLCEERLHMSCEGFKTAPEDEWLCIVCRLQTLDIFVLLGVIWDPSIVNNR